MHWQSAGDFLCVQVTRTTRRGKTQFTSMELFRLRDKNVPIEMLKIEDPVIHFAWEPSRTRFSVIHGNVRCCFLACCVLVVGTCFAPLSHSHACSLCFARFAPGTHKVQRVLL